MNEFLAVAPHAQVAHGAAPLFPLSGLAIARVSAALSFVLEASRKLLNAGCRSGIDLPITPASRPVYSSRMLNTAPVAAGVVSSYTRVPLNSPKGKPPAQTIRRGTSSSVTRSGNARPGLCLTNTVTFEPRSTWPDGALHGGVPSGPTGQVDEDAPNLVDRRLNVDARGK